MKHFSKFIVILTTLCFIGGCAMVPSGSPELHQRAQTFTPPPGMASIYIYRPFNFFAGGVHFDIDLDNSDFGTLAVGTYLFGNVSPGKHAIRARTVGATRTTPEKFEAEAGKLYFFEIGPTFRGFKIEPVDEKKGREQIGSYTLSGENIFKLEEDSKK